MCGFRIFSRAGSRERHAIRDLEDMVLCHQALRKRNDALKEKLSSEEAEQQKLRLRIVEVENDLENEQRLWQEGIQRLRCELETNILQQHELLAQLRNRDEQVLHSCLSFHL